MVRHPANVGVVCYHPLMRRPDICKQNSLPEFNYFAPESDRVSLFIRKPMAPTLTTNRLCVRLCTSFNIGGVNGSTDPENLPPKILQVINRRQVGTALVTCACTRGWWACFVSEIHLCGVYTLLWITFVFSQHNSIANYEDVLPDVRQ